MLGSMVLQVLTLLIGQSVNGNRNWLNIPLVGPVQPSEFMKLAIVLQVAAILTETADGWNDFKYSWGKAIVWVALGAGLVIIGSDLGTVIIMALFVLIELALAGLPRQWLNYALLLGVIGEEFGLVGSIVVIGLFVVLSVVLIRILRHTEDLWSRIVVGGVAGWLVIQALVNIAVVLSLLPVLGVPLPLISKGGSSLISNLAAIGVVLAIARNNHSGPRAFNPRLAKARRR